MKHGCGTDSNGSQKAHYIRIMAGEKTWQSQTELKTLRDVINRDDFLRGSRYMTSPHACGRSVSSLFQLDTIIPKQLNIWSYFYCNEILMVKWYIIVCGCCDYVYIES